MSQTSKGDRRNWKLIIKAAKKPPHVYLKNAGDVRNYSLERMQREKKSTETNDLLSPLPQKSLPTQPLLVELPTILVGQRYARETLLLGARLNWATTKEF